MFTSSPFACDDLSFGLDVTADSLEFVLADGSALFDGDALGPALVGSLGALTVRCASGEVSANLHLGRFLEGAAQLETLDVSTRRDWSVYPYYHEHNGWLSSCAC